MTKTEVFQCSLCQVYFESGLTAKKHLQNRHSLKIRLDSSKCRKIKIISLPDVKINISRVINHNPNNVDLSQTEMIKPKPKRKTRRSKHTVHKTVDGGVEIQLDNLKASEIETLMNDLFQRSNSTGNTELSTRKSTRKSAVLAEEHIKTCTKSDETQDPDEERFISSRKKSSKQTDNDYIPSVPSKEKNKYDEDQEDDCEIVTKKGRRGRKRKTETNEKSKEIRRGNWKNCSICHLNCNSPKELMDHLTNLHLTGGKFICPNCQDCFDDPKNFNRHLRTHNKSKGYECDICGKKIAHLYTYQAHKRYHEKILSDPKKILKCPVCPQRFAIKRSVSRHFVLHLETNPYVCKFLGCSSKFSNWEHLQRHVALHIGGVTFKCKHCDGQFNRRDGLRKHVFAVHSKGANKGKTPRKRPLRVERINTDNGKVPCVNEENSNEEDFSGPTIVPKEETDEIRIESESVHLSDNDQDSPANLEDVKEEEKVQNQETKLEELSQINRECLRTIMLKDPVYLKLAQENPEAARLVLPTKYGYHAYNIQKQEFKCNLCDWFGYKAYLLQTHMKKVHDENSTLLALQAKDNEKNDAPSEEMNIMCGSCGFHAKTSDELTEHMNKEHPQKSKYECKICGHRFSKKDRRDRHEKNVHLQRKKFACSKCPMAYLHKYNLRQHELTIHDEEYRKKMRAEFKCKECGRELLNKASLRFHMSTHTQDRSVTCKICKQICADKNVLKRHIAYVHLNITNPYNVGLGKKPRKDHFVDKNQKEVVSVSTSDLNTGDNSVAKEPNVNSEESTILGI